MTKNLFSKILRDREAFFDEILRSEKIGSIIISMMFGSLLLFAIYGLVMGIYNSPAQAASTALKVPILFILALIICYPALFIFNILLGSKLSFAQSLAMILTAYVLAGCVLASFAPIVAFFMLIGSSYTFLRLLHVAIFGIAGFTGMSALNSGLIYACEEHAVYPKQGVRIFKIWVLIFAFVGTQLAWNLRPFLGNRDLDFQLFRKQEGNFYIHMLRTTGEFLFGEKTPPSSKTYEAENYDSTGDIDLKIKKAIQESETQDDSQ